MSDVASSTSAVGKEDEKKPVIPPGYRFHPNDYELILFYLLNKNLGLKLPTNFIQDIDDMYHYHPRQIPSGGLYFMNSQSYIFTRLNKETACGTTPQSDWEAIGEEESVYAGNQVIGFKKKFLFWENSRRDNKGCWLLSEYRINPDIFPYTRDIISSKVQGWVACKIEYKGGELPLEFIPEEQHEDEGDDRIDEDLDEEEDKNESDEEEEDTDEHDGDDRTAEDADEKEEDKTQKFGCDHKCSGRKIQSNNSTGKLT